jgi:hypothetical protein
VAWCKLEDTFRYHPKIKKLAADLGVPPVQVRGHLTSLWSWAVVNARDGDLRDFDEDDIEFAADWKGLKGIFVEFALKNRVLDRKYGKISIHGWMSRAGSYKKAKQKQKERAKADGLSRDMSRREEIEEIEEIEESDTVATSVWSDGDQITNAEEFETAVQHLGVSLGPSVFSKLANVLKGGAIEPHEWRAAMRVTLERGKGIAYLLGVIAGSRKEAANGEPSPGARGKTTQETRDELASSMRARRMTNGKG